MRDRIFTAGLLLAFAAELAVLASFTVRRNGDTQDTVAVNEIVQTVQRDWGALGDHIDATGFDYVVLDADGTVLYLSLIHI